MSTNYGPETCRICGINDAFSPTCSGCHSLYWEFEKTLTPEQNDELQIAFFKRQDLPLWFKPWWERMTKLKAFI